jgi:hypothetical protein
MSEEKKLLTPLATFPSEALTDAEKQSIDYGLQIGQAIQYEWFKRDGSSSRFYSRWDYFHRLRLYARGEQSIAKYKSELAVNGDLSYLNLDWKPVPIIPKFVDVVVNGMQDRMFTVKAYAQDAMSQSNRNRFQDMVEGQMVAKPILTKIQSETGVDPFMMNPDEIPSTDEELQLYMQLKYKPSIEIAEEVAISTIMDENRYYDTKSRCDYDLTVVGIGIAKHDFLPGAGIEISYVDPANAIYSYTEDPYFRDCFYWGEVKTVPITELYKIKPDITRDEIEAIQKVSNSWYDYHNVQSRFDDVLYTTETVTLLYYDYKTTKDIVYKKKNLSGNAKRVIRKEDTFNPPEEMMEEGGFERIKKTIDVWYNGVMVMGSNIVLQWKMCENMVRPKSSVQHAIPRYVAVAPRMYKGNIESLVSRMIPFADLIQITHLKLQQVISRVVPDGVYIDVDGINEVDMGTGGEYTPEDALRLYFSTGSVVGRSYTSDGEFNHGKVPIKELGTNSGLSKTQMLIANYNHYLDMIRAVTGLNEARDASDPDPRSLVGLQKMAALNSNTATRHILDGGLYIFRSVAEAMTYRVADLLKYSEFKDGFINRVGRYNTMILEDIKDLYLYDFGIFIEVSPDEEQKAQLEANIQMALSRGDINLEDAIDIREIKNIKLANQLLKVKRKAKQEQEQKMEMQKQAMQAQINQQSQALAVKAAQVKAEADAQAKISVRKAEAFYDIEKMKQEAALKKELMREEFNYNMQLAGIEVQGIEQRDKMKEDAKDRRISKQSTQQSTLINQRKNNTPPVSFESNEDSLDGFSLEEFSPR